MAETQKPTDSQEPITKTAEPKTTATNGEGKDADQKDDLIANIGGEFRNLVIEAEGTEASTRPTTEPLRLEASKDDGEDVDTNPRIAPVSPSPLPRVSPPRPKYHSSERVTVPFPEKKKVKKTASGPSDPRMHEVPFTAPSEADLSLKELIRDFASPSQEEPVSAPAAYPVEPTFTPPYSSPERTKIFKTTPPREVTVVGGEDVSCNPENLDDPYPPAQIPPVARRRTPARRLNGRVAAGVAGGVAAVMAVGGIYWYFRSTDKSSDTSTSASAASASNNIQKDPAPAPAPSADRKTRTGPMAEPQPGKPFSVSCKHVTVALTDCKGVPAGYTFDRSKSYPWEFQLKSPGGAIWSAPPSAEIPMSPQGYFVTVELKPL